MELGSVDQARELVKFHGNFPPTVNGQKIGFSISSTFNFLQVKRSELVSCYRATDRRLGEEVMSA